MSAPQDPTEPLTGFELLRAAMVELRHDAQVRPTPRHSARYQLCRQELGGEILGMRKI